MMGGKIGGVDREGSMQLEGERYERFRVESVICREKEDKEEIIKME